MKLTKNTIRELIKEELINERKERERTPAFAYLRKVQEYFDDVAEDVEDSELVIGGTTAELKKASQEWLTILQRDREAIGDLFTEIDRQRRRIEKDVERLNIATNNIRILQKFILGKSESGRPPKFVMKRRGEE